MCRSLSVRCTRVVRRVFPWFLLGFISVTNSWSASGSSSEPRFKVAIIDSGLDLRDPRFKDVLCATGHKDFTGTGLKDQVGHGTAVASVLVRNAPDHTKYCLLVLKVFNTSGVNNFDTVGAAIYAKSEGAQYVNMSFAGPGYDQEERDALAKLDLIITAAAGNEDQDVSQAFPAGYNIPGMNAVGNWDCKKKKKGPMSNTGSRLSWRCGTNIPVWAPNGGTSVETGTSLAAPLYLAELVNKRIKEMEANAKSR